MTDPFYRDFIFDDEQMDYLKQRYKELEGSLHKAGVYKDGENTTGDERVCEHVSVQHKHAPDISMALNDAARNDWGADFPENAWFAQFEFIKYSNPNDRFERHIDDNPEASNHNRIFTSVTMIDRSDDLKGCELTVWVPPNEKEYIIDLEVGETVMFPAWYWHQANDLIKGSRVVLISWCQFQD